MREREIKWLKETTAMQDHLETKWPLYKQVSATVRKMYDSKEDATVIEIIKAADEKIKAWDIDIQLDSFCKSNGQVTDNIRDVMARLGSEPNQIVALI